MASNFDNELSTQSSQNTAGTNLSESEELTQDENNPEETDLNFDDSTRNNLIIGIVLVSILLLSFGFGYYYSNKVSDQNLKITELDSQISVLEMQIKAEEEKGNKQKAELRKLKEELSSPAHRILWSEVIAEIERATHQVVADSDNTAIYNFNGYTLNDNGSISLSGFTNSYPAIADLIEGFEKSPMFKDIKFNSSSKSVSEDGTERATLSLSFQLETPEEEPAAVSNATILPENTLPAENSAPPENT